MQNIQFFRVIKKKGSQNSKDYRSSRNFALHYYYSLPVNHRSSYLRSEE
ncbi:MAG: hypothetical protein ACI90V_013608 [Bacillariaceae sp.]|jgi:hypothetical protein